MIHRLFLKLGALSTTPVHSQLNRLSNRGHIGKEGVTIKRGEVVVFEVIFSWKKAAPSTLGVIPLYTRCKTSQT